MSALIKALTARGFKEHLAKGVDTHHLGVLVKSLTPLSKGLLVAAREEDEPREALCHSA